MVDSLTMKLNIAQVVGLNTDQKAAQVISSSQDGDNSFFAVLELSSDDAFTKGRQILSEASDFYFDFEGSPADKLKATFEEIQEKVTDGEFALLLASISGKILYLVGIGEVVAYLKRSEKLSPLLVVGASGQLISGFLKDGDKLLLSTASLTSFLGDDLDKSLDLPIETFEEEVTDRIGASNLEDQGLAALVAEVNSDIIQDQAEQPSQAQVKEQVEQDNIPNLQEEVDYQDSSESSVDTQASLFSNIKQIPLSLLGFIWQKKSYLPKSGRGRLLIVALLIIVIVLGVGFKIKKSKDAQKQAAFKQVLQQARDDFNGAKGLSTLNPAEAKGKLDSAKDKINQALTLQPKDNEAQDLKKQIETDSGSILQQSSLSEFPLFLDLDLVKKNFRATQISLSNGKILLLDPAVKTLVAIDVAKKSPQILAGSEQLGEASYFSLNGGLAFVYSKDKGILKIDITNQKITSVSKKDSELGEIKDIYGFASNIYLLDATKNQIWKYLPTADSYSDKREYLTKNSKVDFTNTLRMQIESSVYILKSGGEMLRFTRGDKDNFSYGGLEKGVKDPKSLFVSSDTDSLYLLDSGNSRLLILTKTGSYKGQISGDKFAQASDLVVDEKGKKVYLLDGSKIYAVDLK